MKQNRHIPIKRLQFFKLTIFVFSIILFISTDHQLYYSSFAQGESFPGDVHSNPVGYAVSQQNRQNEILLDATKSISNTQSTINNPRSNNMIFIPALLKRWPPMPSTPKMKSILAPEAGSYLLEWSDPSDPDSSVFTIQEAADNAFTQNVIEACKTALTSCQISNKTAGVYYYRTQEQNNWGTSAWSVTQSAEVLPPGIPTIDPIDNANGDGAYVVKWNATARTAWYLLQEASKPDFSDAQNIYSGDKTSYSISSRMIGVYYYHVIAVGPTGQSEPSPFQTAIVPAPGLPVINPINNADGDGSYTVTWNPAAGADWYLLQEASTLDFSNAQNIYSGSSLSFPVSNKTQGTFYYRLIAVGATGQSDPGSPQAVVVLPPDTPVLNAIDNSDGDGNYSITWNASLRTTSYVLEESTSSDFSTRSTIFSGASLSVNISLKPYGTFYYRVQAVGPTGQSTWSNIQSAVVPPPPPGVSILKNYTTYASSSYQYVLGEVYNNTNNYLKYVKIAVNFFNNNLLVGTDYTYTYLDAVHPYEKACFEIMLTKPASWNAFSFETVSYWTGAAPRPNLTLVPSPNGYVYLSSYFRILGQIRNDLSQTIQFVEAVSTLYDNQGKVIGCDFGYVNSTDLAPGATSSFEILARPQNPYSVSSYTLQTDGWNP